MNEQDHLMQPIQETEREPTIREIREKKETAPEHASARLYHFELQLALATNQNDFERQQSNGAAQIHRIKLPDIAEEIKDVESLLADMSHSAIINQAQVDEMEARLFDLARRAGIENLDDYGFDMEH